MSCEKHIELISATLDGEATADERAELEAHISECADCQERLEGARALKHAVARLPGREKPTEAVQARIEVLRFGPSRSHRRPWRRRAVVSALAIACMLAALIVATRVRVGRRPPMPTALAEELALDHLHYLHLPDAAKVRGSPAVLASYFRNKLGFSPHYGHLDGANFEGAKPCRIAGRWTALAWLDRAGHRLSLFTMPREHLASQGCVGAEGVHVCGAPDPRGGARVVVGDLPQPELLRLVHESLE